MFDYNDYVKGAMCATLENVQKQFAAADNGTQSVGDALRNATALLRREGQRLEIIKSIHEIEECSDKRIRAMKAYWFAHRLMDGDEDLQANPALALVWLKNAADWGDDRAQLEIGEF